MNIQHFRESLDLTFCIGATLNTERALLVENSLIILQNENKLKNMFFWGRIHGIEKDYFIAFSCPENIPFERIFFYSMDCIDWQKLELPNLDIMFEASIACKERFVGDITYITTVKLHPKFNVDENGTVSITSYPEEIELKEEHRLACVIHLITEESALIPRGGLYEMPDKKIIFNPSFKGLNKIEANDLCNYQLFRKPRNKYNENLLKRYDYNYAVDFLDTLDDIPPKNYSFSFSIEKDDHLILIKSLIWPGMVFFHKINSNLHGFVYMGDGKKNLSLFFMIT